MTRQEQRGNPNYKMPPGAYYFNAVKSMERHKAMMRFVTQATWSMSGVIVAVLIIFFFA